MVQWLDWAVTALVDQWTSPIFSSPPPSIGPSNFGVLRWAYTNMQKDPTHNSHGSIWSICSFSTQSNRPLYSFDDSSDYVYDTMWSPTHPALFACVDLSGRLDLWNLNNDTEVHRNTIYSELYPKYCQIPFLMASLVWCVFSRFPLPVCVWKGLQHWTEWDGLTLAKRSLLETQKDRSRSMM